MSKCESIEYNQVAKICPRYKYNQIIPANGSTTQNMSESGGEEITFKIPSCAFNLSESYLQYDLKIPILGDDGKGNDYSPWVFADVLGPIRQIQLYTNSNVFLADINNVNFMTKAMCKQNTKLDEFLSFDIGLAETGITFQSSGIETRSILSRSSYTDSINKRYNNTDMKTNTENLYVIAGQPEQTATISYKIPLRHLTETIFSIDKILYLNEIVTLKLALDSYQRVTYMGTSVDNPETGNEFMDPEDEKISLSKLSLYLAVAIDPLINQELRKNFSSVGLSISIPYLHCYSYSYGIGSNHINLRFNRGHGRLLQKIYVIQTLQNPAEAYSIYETSNTIGAPSISKLYSTLNNERIQDIDIDCQNYDDWAYLQNKMSGSVIQGSNHYKYNWFWVDDFTNSSKLYNYDSNNYIGEPLDKEQKYDLYFTAPNYNLQYYVFAVCQKLLTVSTAGITVI